MDIPRAAAAALLLVSSSGCSVAPAVRSSVLRTGPTLAPSSSAVAVTAALEPSGAQQLGMVEAWTDAGATLDRVLAEFRARVAELGGDLGRIDGFPTTYGQVLERTERECGSNETRWEDRTVFETAPDGTLTPVTRSEPVTTYVSRTCPEARLVEVATLKLVGRAFRRPAGAAAAPAASGGVQSQHTLLLAPGSGGAAVRVVMDGEPLPDIAEELALVSARATEGASGSRLLLLARLREEAAALGCDAVVRVRWDPGTASATATGVAVRLR